MTQSHLIRSLFFAPANRPDLITKFPRFDADCCVIDLEDGTPPADKAAARDTLAASVAGLRSAGLRGLLTVRVNEPASEHYLRDIEAAFAAGADGIVIPKLEEAGSLFPALHWIRHLERAAPLPAPRFIIGGLESIRGVTEAQERRHRSPRRWSTCATMRCSARTPRAAATWVMRERSACCRAR